MISRLNLVIFCLLVGAASVGIYWLYEEVAGDELQRARVDYEVMRQSVDALNFEQNELQTEVMALQTHVESVELRARDQYRLITPGEHIAMISMDNQPDEF